MSVALLITGVGTVLTAACWGGIIGAGIGGTMGGFVSLAQGKSFLQGFEKGAFEGCRALEKINLPKDVKEIFVFAFRGCTGLKEIHFLSKLMMKGIS